MVTSCAAPDTAWHEMTRCWSGAGISLLKTRPRTSSAELRPAQHPGQRKFHPSIRLMANVFFIFLILIAPAHAERAVAPDDLLLRIEVEPRPAVPYTEEMILVRIRGSYKIPITLENLKQPPLDGFGWMQLGPDRWFHSRERGQKVLQLERIMALFPERAGTLTIAPFTHELTLSEPDGTRFTHDLKSEPVEIEVAEAPGPRKTWLPVRKIRVADRWSNAPEQLAPGAAALRLVTVTIEGVQPETMPPMPELTGAGAFILPHPERRLTELRKTGPITRVFWRWSIRPDRGRSGYVDPLTFSYYDAEAREPRSITLSAQKVAYSGTDLPLGERPGDAITPVAASPSRDTAGYASALIPFAPFVGFIGGLAFLLGGTRLASRDTLWHKWHGFIGNPAERAFHHAIRAGDSAAARHASRRIIDADLIAERYTAHAANQAYAPHFAPLDAGLYGNGAQASLKKFAKDFKAARRALLK